MKMTRLYTREDGESAFEDAEIREDDIREVNGFRARLSEKYPAKTVKIIHLPDGYNQVRHNAPCRQLVSVISGALEVITSQGVAKVWRPGEVFFAEDVTGAGHRSASVDGATTMLIVELPEDFDHAVWAVAAPQGGA